MKVIVFEYDSFSKDLINSNNSCDGCFGLNSYQLRSRTNFFLLLLIKSFRLQYIYKICSNGGIISK